MADGGLKIELDKSLSERVKAAADAAGRTVSEFAADLISKGLGEGWAETYASLAEYDRTGEYVDADAALAGFRAELERRLAAR